MQESLRKEKDINYVLSYSVKYAIPISWNKISWIFNIFCSAYTDFVYKFNWLKT